MPGLVLKVCLVFCCVYAGSGNVWMRSHAHDYTSYIKSAFKTARNTYASKSSRVSKPMVMTPNFHQLVAYPRDEQTLMKQKNLADLREKTIKELSVATGMPASDILYERKLRVEIERQFKPICDKVVGEIKCDPNARYRTINGTCNNLRYPDWGAADIVQQRYLPAEYRDGFSKPRMLDANGKDLPSARKISDIVFRGEHESRLDKQLTVFVMSFGQFIDHEFINTPVLKRADGSDYKCCGKDKYFEGCIPISIPKSDPHFTKDCMNLVRSAQAVGRTCIVEYRQQLNRATSFIDASAVYGNNVKEMEFLRQYTGGLLKTGPFELLPESKTENCMKDLKSDYCQTAGDGRANVVPSLGATHTLFMREHNRIAKTLSKINPHWNDETLYQEARKIISAVLQHITYDEYLPLVLGDYYMDKFGLRSHKLGFNDVYNQNVDPSTSNAFGAAAFRFGHSQIPKIQAFMRYESRQRKEVLLEDTFHRPKFIQADDGRGCRENLHWLFRDKQPKSDRILEKGVHDLLFLKDQVSLDLGAINIQRGRDHGIPSYNKWRKWCHLPVAHNFYNHYTGLIDHTRHAARLLRKAYRNPEDIDLFAGGLSEKLVRGGTVGPTFACIIGRQFHDYKYGDRFWYETSDKRIGFTVDQVNSIKRYKLSKMVCENGNFPTIQPNAFMVPDRKFRNADVRCSELPDLDLSLWRDRGPYNKGNNVFVTENRLPLHLFPTVGIPPPFVTYFKK